MDCILNYKISILIVLLIFIININNLTDFSNSISKILLNNFNTFTK